MKKKLQVALTDESWEMLESISHDANDGFKNGCITFSDIINEVLSNAKIDLKGLQAKHTNIRKSLRLLASQKEIDIDLAIRNLMELKAKSPKKSSKQQISIDGGEM